MISKGCATVRGLVGGRGRLLARLCSSTTHYNRLGVSRNASSAEIKSAFLRLTKEHHPDLSPASQSQEAHKKFMQIKEAYSVLINPAKLRVYDQQVYTEQGKPYPHFASSSTEEERFGFYRYNPQTSTYSYRRAYNFYDVSDAEREELRTFRRRTQRNHFKVIKILVVLMVSGTLLHSARIYYTHRNHRRKAERDTRRNMEVYQAIREQGRNSTIQEQLDRLAHHHQQHSQNHITKNRGKGSIQNNNVSHKKN